MVSERALDFYRYVAQTSARPLGVEVVRTSGSRFFGPKGERYLDLISGVAVSALGHGHAEVMEAVRSQLDKYAHVMVYGEVVLEAQTALAKELVSSLAPSLEQVFFVTSGSEAVEGALKMAKKWTGRSKLCAFEKAYHGGTHGALSLVGSEKFRQPYRPLLPDVCHLRFGVEEDLDLLDEETAAVVVEPVQGEAGVRTASPAYFKQLSSRCEDRGIVLIADEIQTGLGRTGTLWAFEHCGFVPDVLLTAKALGGGFPLGAFVAKKDMMQVLANRPSLGHISTFGGHPVSCVAGLSTLQVIRREQLYLQAQAKADLFKQHLASHPKVKAFRSVGLMICVELASKGEVAKVLPELVQVGLLVDGFLFCPEGIRIAPPLNISTEDIEEACQKMLGVLDQS